jgi:hypothetical protein
MERLNHLSEDDIHLMHSVCNAVTRVLDNDAERDRKENF